MPFNAPEGVKGKSSKDMTKLLKSLLLLGGPAGVNLAGAKQIPGIAGRELVESGKTAVSPKLLQLGLQSGSGRVATKLPGGIFPLTRGDKSRLDKLFEKLFSTKSTVLPKIPPGKN